MKSTDQNLNNPMRVDQVQLSPTASLPQTLAFKPVTQEEYKLTQVKDPYTVYFIEDIDTHPMYIGDTLIRKDSTDHRYFITINDRDEYEIYQNHPMNNHDNLVYICKFKEMQDACNALRLFTRSGESEMEQEIYQIICSYIQNCINLNDLLLGILSVAGYKNDPKFNDLVAFTASYILSAKQSDDRLDDHLPPILLNRISFFRMQNSDSLYNEYSTLYDLIVKFNYFRGDKYKTSEPNLSDEIHEIIGVLMSKYKIQFATEYPR